SGHCFGRGPVSPFRIPYQVNIDTYGLVYFPWQPLRTPPEYHHAVMRDFYQGRYNIGEYQEARWHPFEKLAASLWLLWLFFLGPMLSLPLVAWAIVRPRKRFGKFVSRKSRFLLSVCALSSIGLFLPIYVPQPHYAGPLTPAIYALVIQGMRHTRLWRWDHQPSGSAIVLGIPVVCVVLLFLRLPAADDQVLRQSPNLGFIRTWCSPQYMNLS